ncbi:MAG: hypothetical protein OEZ13_13745 [Spirochaetia bacterium]|nr:hypothetical protein [Spirochaetia bacterium]
MKINKLIFNIFIIISFFLIQHCIVGGAAGKIKLKNSKYPVSLSHSLYDNDGKIVSEKNGLETIKHFKYNTSYWSILYTFIDLSDDEDITMYLNTELDDLRGDGVINLEIENKQCINHMFIPMITILPFWPSCTNINLEGDFVRLKK